MRQTLRSLEGAGIGMLDTPATLTQQIDTWRHSARENQHLEFKEARTQFEMSRLREYCVALANEGGGHLLLGIADRPPRPVVGTRAFRDVVAAAERLYEGLGVSRGGGGSRSP